MNHFCNYFSSTGRIAQVYSLPDGVAPFKLDGTELLALDGPLDKPADYRVVSGTLTHSPIPKQPSPVHVWDEATQTWVASNDDAWRSVRAERDRRISAVDWTQLGDVPGQTRAKYVTYRQALRDITTQSDPLNITWPHFPT